MHPKQLLGHECQRQEVQRIGNALMGQHQTYGSFQPAILVEFGHHPIDIAWTQPSTAISTNFKLVQQGNELPA